MTTHVRMLQAIFVPKVRAGTKIHTIRPTPKRRPVSGDIIDFHTWDGKAYRSGRTYQFSVRVSRCEDIRLSNDGVRIANGAPLNKKELNKLAVCDGFDNWERMHDWFNTQHGLLVDFVGVIIYWSEVLP